MERGPIVDILERLGDQHPLLGFHIGDDVIRFADLALWNRLR